MKNINFIIILIINIPFNNLHGAILDELNNTRQNLMQAQQQITKSEQELTATYNTLNSTIIAKIDEQVNTGIIPDKIADLTKLITEIIDQTKGQWIRDAICLNELVPTIEFIKDDILVKIKNSLIDVRNNFKTAIIPLDVSKDTAGIYAAMEEAKAEFAAADQGFADLQDGLLEFASEPPAPKSTPVANAPIPPAQKPQIPKGQTPEGKIAEVKKTIDDLSQPMTALNKKMQTQAGGSPDAKETPIGRLHENTEKAFQEINAGTRSIKTPADIENLKQVLLTGIDEAAIKKIELDANAVLDQLNQYLQAIKTLTSVSDIAKASVGDVEIITAPVKTIYNQLLTNKKNFYDLLDEKIKQADLEQIKHDINTVIPLMTTLNQLMITLAGGDANTPGTPIAQLTENTTKTAEALITTKKTEKTATDPDKIKNALLKGIDQAKIVKTKQDAQALVDQLNTYLQQAQILNLTTDAAKKSTADIEASANSIKTIFNQLIGTNKAFDDAVTEKIEQVNLEQIKHALENIVQPMTTLSNTMTTLAGGQSDNAKTPLGHLNKVGQSINKEITAGTRPTKTPADQEKIKNTLLASINEKGILKTKQLADSLMEQLSIYLQQTSSFTQLSDVTKTLVNDIETTANTIKTAYNQLLATHKALYDAVDEYSQQATSSVPNSQEKPAEISKK